MQRITNLTNSPYEVMKSDGVKVIAPAFGSIDGDFDKATIELFVMCGAISVEDIEDEKPSDNVSEAPRRGRPPKSKVEE